MVDLIECGKKNDTNAIVEIPLNIYRKNVLCILNQSNHLNVRLINIYSSYIYFQHFIHAVFNRTSPALVINQYAHSISRSFL